MSGSSSGFSFGLPLNFTTIAGVTATEVLGSAPAPANVRKIVTDNLGRLQVVSPAGVPLLAQIFGVAGDGVTLNPMRQVLFTPRTAAEKGGWRGTVGAASAVVTGGGLTTGLTYHLEVTVHTWISRGAVGSGTTAVIGDGAGGGTTHLSPGKVYEYIPQDASQQELAVIRDTLAAADGVIFISAVEA